MLDAEPLKPSNGVVQPMVLEVKPLANAHLRRPPAEMLQRELGRSVLAQQAHGKMPIVSGPFCLAVPRCRRPRARQVIETVPVNARRATDQKLRSAVEPPRLHLLGAEA